MIGDTETFAEVLRKHQPIMPSLIGPMQCRCKDFYVTASRPFWQHQMDELEKAEKRITVAVESEAVNTCGPAPLPWSPEIEALAFEMVSAWRCDLEAEERAAKAHAAFDKAVAYSNEGVRTSKARKAREALRSKLSAEAREAVERTT